MCFALSHGRVLADWVRTGQPSVQVFTRCFCRAMATASDRLAAPSLARMAVMWIGRGQSFDKTILRVPGACPACSELFSVG